MTQTVRRIPGQRADVRRPGSVYLFRTRCVDEHGMPCGGVEDGYVGQSRDVARRAKQHAGLVPQRDGTVAEQSWWDLVEGDVQILAKGNFTDAELDDLERQWIRKLQPRYNDLENELHKGRIRKIEAARHRATRDAAKPRWQTLLAKAVRSPVTWWLGAWLALTVGAWNVVGWLAGLVGIVLPATYQALGSAVASAVTLAAVALLWLLEGRQAWRRLWRRP